MNKKICIVYTHHKLGDLIWQLPYLKAISDHHGEKVDLVVIRGVPENSLNQVIDVLAQEIVGGVGVALRLAKLPCNADRLGRRGWEGTRPLFTQRHDYLVVVEVRDIGHGL